MVLRLNNKILIKKTKLANTPWLRFKGLMFEKKETFNYALIFDFPFESRISSSLHMLFMNFQVDVIFLNSKKEVVDKVTLKPFGLKNLRGINYTPKKAAKFVIEAPVGVNKKIKLGNKLNW